jgi:hypothetical protein
MSEENLEDDFVDRAPLCIRDGLRADIQSG